MAALPSRCLALTPWGCRHSMGGTHSQPELLCPPLLPQALLKEESMIPRGCEEQGLEVQPSLIPPRGLFSTDGYQK